MNKSYIHIINFLVGGIFVAFIAFIVQKFNIKLASIAYSLPFSLLVILIVMWYDGYKNEDMANMCSMTSQTLILLFIFLYVLQKILRHYNHNRYGIFYGIISGLIIWCIAAFIYYYIF